MRTILSVMALVLCLGVATSGFAGDNNLIGKWKEKNVPPEYHYEFKENSDFIYTTTYKDGSGSTKIGVWEVGAWEITTNKNVKTSTCNLSIYAGTYECCFEYKFIADNLILSEKYKSSSSSMCNNRVLIREE